MAGAEFALKIGFISQKHMPRYKYSITVYDI